MNDSMSKWVNERTEVISFWSFIFSVICYYILPMSLYELKLFQDLVCNL